MGYNANGYHALIKEAIDDALVDVHQPNRIQPNKGQAKSDWIND